MRAFYATKLSEHLSETPEGYLVALGCPVARDGTQIYRRSELGIPGNGEDQIVVMRPHDEVFSPATMASFEGKPVVSPHPSQFVGPENWASYAKGHLQHVRKGEPFPDGTTPLVADFVITDATLISQVKAGLREVSAGYDCKYVEVSDEHDPSIQFEQTNIRGNHAAIIFRGRAGSNVRILDEQPDVSKEGVSVDIKALKEGLTDLKDVILSLGFRPPELLPVKAGTTDADPGAVERNAEKNSEALERAKMRNKDEVPEQFKKKEEKEEEKKEESKDAKSDKDGGEKEMKKEEAGAEKPKESKDSGTRDAALDRVADALDRLSRRMDAAEEKEKEKEKKAEEKKEESQDSELIPVETLASKDIPKNPIPGAEKSVDAVKDALLAIKPALVAAFRADPVKFHDAAVEWNNGWRAANGKSAADDAAYGSIAAGRKKSDEVLAAEAGGRVPMQDAEDGGASAYAEEMRTFNRRHAGEVIKEKARVN